MCSFRSLKFELFYTAMEKESRQKRAKLHSDNVPLCSRLKINSICFLHICTFVVQIVCVCVHIADIVVAALLLSMLIIMVALMITVATISYCYQKKMRKRRDA